MRRVALPAVLALLTVLAGCSLAVAPGSVPATTATPAQGTTVTPADGGADASPTPSPSSPTTDQPDPGPERPDPETDRLGWENGYWYDDPVAADNSDGLNDSEQAAVVARAMARVEQLRGLEFNETVPVTVVSRANYSARNANRSTSPALRTFDNAKFEALFLVGEDEGSIDVQNANRNQTVAGFYSPKRSAIVVVSDAANPRFDGERTLAHELVHALQDQHFNLSATDVQTRDAYNGRNGLIEGDATVVQNEYMANCGESWACLQVPSEGNASGGGQLPHFGIYFMQYFPYESGPDLIDHLRETTDDWSAVNDGFGDPPSTSRVVLEPSLYGSFDTETVDIADDLQDGWQRVRPPDRADYAVLGQSAITPAFAYTLYDSYNSGAVIEPGDFLNLEDGVSVNRTDPFNYGLPFVQGWTGDRLHVYERDDELAYVWRLTWESPGEAEQFADAYRQLLSHWGGSQVEANTWRIADDSPFADAFHLEVDGSTVTIANAPDVGELPAVYPGAR